MLRWNEKGFGFVKPDAGGEEAFVHCKSIEGGGDSLPVGARVSCAMAAAAASSRSFATTASFGVGGIATGFASSTSSRTRPPAPSAATRHSGSGGKR